MDAKSYLKDHIRQVEPILQRFFDQKISEAASLSPICEEMISRYKEFTWGGKNLRGAQIRLGYEVFGGKDIKAILKASLVIEIIHSFLLIHDDIMDQDPLRRGRPTIHKQYEAVHENTQQIQKGAPDHYGTCMALDLGEIGCFLAYGLLAESAFPPEIKVRAFNLLSKILLRTGYGQGLDVTYELYPQVDYEDIFRVHRNKTSYYTVTGPLGLGATLAGANTEEIKKIEPFGDPVGIAFQIRDDELGLFSDKKSLGKPIGSDVKENKNTLLRLKAMEKAEGKDKQFLEQAYGNRDLTDKEVERVRKITLETGALDYSQKTGWDLVEEGKKYIGQITKDSHYQKLLASFADFMMERKS